MFTWFGHNRIPTDTTTRRELAMKVFDAVDFAFGTKGEWHVVQNFSTHLAPEAVWMKRLSGGAEYPIDNRFRANATFFQSL